MNYFHTTIAIGTLLASTLVNAAEIRVAVAANFAQTLKEIVTVFEKDTGHKVALTQG